MKLLRLVSLVSIVLLLLLMALAGSLAGAAAPQQTDPNVATATPLVLPTLVPPVSMGDDSTVQQLAQAVEVANLAAGASTSWRGHQVVDSNLPFEVGEKLPGFGLMTRAGDVFRLDVVGEPILLNFWASWCGPCEEEFPRLIAADSDPTVPFRVAFVNVWDDAHSYEEFLTGYPAIVQVMRDEDDVIAMLYGLDFIPVSILVDEHGEIVLIQHGLVHDEVLQLAASLLQTGE